MSQLASEPTDASAPAHRMSMPGRLWGVLAVVVLQALANGFFGWLIIDGLNQDAGDGMSTDGSGVLYFAGYLSVVTALLLLICVGFTVHPQNWARPVIITVESVTILSAAVSMFSGAVAAGIGLVVAIAIIVSLNKDDVRDWYQHGRE